MQFMQWVVEWSMIADVWIPVTVRRKSTRHDRRKPLMADTKQQSLWLKKMHISKATKGVKYRVRKVTFGEIDCD